jgi:hypothetical protein
MSTDALTDILQILRKHSNISVKVTISTSKKGFHLTNIHLTEPTGIQSSQVSAGKKIRKSPSRLLRDSKRNEAYLSKKAGACYESAASQPSPSTTQSTNPAAARRMVKPGRRSRLDPSSDRSEEKSVGFRPAVNSSPIPQLDGGEDSKDKKDEEKELECEHNYNFVRLTKDLDPVREVSFVCDACNKEQYFWDSSCDLCKQQLCTDCTLYSTL